MNRYFIVLIAALFVLLGGLVTIGATVQARDEALRGYADAARESNLPYRVPRFGVNVDLTQYDDVELNTQLDLMQDAHVGWIRQFFRWDVVAPTPNAVEWATYDRIVGAISERDDMELIVVLFGTPEWARDSRAADDPTAPPESLDTWTDFVQGFAERYKDSINVYQIWDEPNLESAWGGLPPQPVEYLAMLDAGYKAIHETDLNATVVAAALAPNEEHGPRNISDWQYLNTLYNLDGGSSFDAVAAKPYGFDTSPEDRVVREDVLNFSRIVTLREIMIANGDGKKALWASNWGWNSLPADWSGDPSIWGAVTPEQQVQYTIEALDRAEQEWSWLGGMILHQWQPNAPCSDPQWGFAIIACDGSPTLLFNALAARTPIEAVQNGLHFPTSEFASYSGVWTFGSLGADIGWVQDSQASFVFSGSDVSLLVREDDYVAFLYVTVDGQPANALPRDTAGRAYVNLTSDTRLPDMRMVTLATNLGGGTHTLEIVADRGWDRWAIAGFGVSSGDLAAPYQRQIDVAVATTLFGTVGAIIAISQLQWAVLLRRVRRPFSLLSNSAQVILSAAASIAVMIGMLLTWSDWIPSVFRREMPQLALAILTAGIVYLQPHIVLLVISVIVLALLLYRQPRTGVLLTLFYAPFFLFPVNLYRFSFPMSELILLITVAVSALRGFVTWGKAWRSSERLNLRRSIHFRSMDAALLAWLLLAAISLLWVDIPGRAATELRTLFIEPILFYVLLRVYGRDRLMLVRLIDTLLLAGLVVSMIGLVQFASGTAIITAEEGAGRLASVYGSPNNVALFLGRCLPFTLAYLVIQTDRQRRIAAGLVLVTMIITIALTQSAGALFLGIPASVALVLFMTLRRRGLYVLGGLAAIAAVVLPIALRSARFQRLLDFAEGTNFFRLRVWESALHMIADHPVTGIGLDQFLYAYRGRYLLPDAWQEPDLSHPHNFLLDIWLRLSILGLLVFAWLQIAFWRSAFALYHRLRAYDPMLLALVIGAMGSMVSLIAHGLVDNSIFVLDLSYVFVLLIGIISNIRAIDAERETVV